jgi:putative transposase
MPTIRAELLDELLKDYRAPADLLGEAGLFRELKKALIERALGAELTEHLGYEKHGRGGASGNARNGHSVKTVLGEDGEVTLSIPRDRAGTFEPQLIPKGTTRLPAMNDQIISLYSGGLTVREVQAHLRRMYGVEVSPDLISRVTDEVLTEVKAWQSRALERLYPVVFFDALRVKIRDEGGTVRNKAVYVALGLTMEGEKQVLGLWIEQTEGAKFWLKVMNELRNRGVEDILISVVDGLKGFPEAIEAVFPKAWTQTCIVHLIRNSLEAVSWKDRKALMPALKAIYQAPTAEAAEAALEAFEAGSWAKRYPTIAPLWRRAWTHVVPFFAFPPAIRRMIYTTNALESLNRGLRKVIKTRGSFPTDDAALKLLYLAIRNMRLRSAPPPAWSEARAQFMILFADRIDPSAS